MVVTDCTAWFYVMLLAFAVLAVLFGNMGGNQDDL